MNLSVVIPAYKATFLDQILKALKNLRCKEILVVDSSPPKERLYPGAARNQGAEQAQGNWILFLDADVELTDEAIRYLNTLDESTLDPKTFYWGLYAAEGGRSIWTRLQNKILSYRFYDLFNEAKSGRHGQSSHLLVNKEWFLLVGGFNPFIRMREDTELAQRAALFGGKHAVVRNFRGIHLKEFSFAGLFRDYFERTKYSLLSHLLYPKAFAGLNPFVSRVLKLLWLSPMALAVLLLFQWSLANLILAMATWASIVAWCGRRVDPKMNFRDFVALFMAAPLMGLGLGLGATAAIGMFLAQKIKFYYSSLFHSLNLAGKYIFKYGSPVHLTHFITNKCNLRCQHCFYKETLDSAPEQMDLEKVQDLYSSVGPLLWLAVAGGEPFLRKDLVPVLSHAIHHSAPKFLTIPTNGFYTERIFSDTLRLLQKFPNQKIALQFSIDGDEETHDRIRGPGSWRRLEASVAKMKTLREAYPQLNLSVITVVSEENEGLYPSLIDRLVRRFGLDQIHINLFRYGHLQSPRLPSELVEKYRETIEYNFRRAERSLGRGYNAWIFKLVTRIAKKQKELIYQTARHDKFMVPCEAGTLSYTVWENGKIGPCEILEDQVGFDNFKSFWKAPSLKNLRCKIKSEKCRCTYECAMTVNALFGRGQYER